MDHHIHLYNSTTNIIVLYIFISNFLEVKKCFDYLIARIHCFKSALYLVIQLRFRFVNKEANYLKAFTHS